MNNEERRDSLADQAAAWIPPWERPAPPRATAAESSDEPADALAPVAGDDRGGTGSPAGSDGHEPRGETTAATSAAEATGEFGETDAPAPTGDTGPTGTPAPAVHAEPGDAPAPAVHAEPGDAPARQEDAEPTPEATSTGDTEGGAAGPVPTGGTDGPAGEGAAAGVPKKQPASRRRVTPAPEPAPVLDDAELRGALEAILLVVDEPVSELTLAQVLDQPAERVGPMLDEIAAGYTAAGHGFELRRAAGGWRLYTRPEYATYVERFVLDGQSVRLTQAALETLAVIAYKQPVTRSRISAIRGVNCDGVIRTLVSRGLVEECGTEPDSGAFLYRTTTMFLEKLGLNSVDDLPPLAPFLPDDVEELADATR
ncbi:SMC-Scp complex subunit ScpB [Micromonospora sp. NPDC047548]|uniref:SMC-Scp complex subunit ScpB n=1 Tax=Micromonospora sp. NPDC047548 TaxID=3155624 RepID=UPI0033FD30A3